MINIFENYENKTLDEIYDSFLNEFNQDEVLQKHRFYIEKNNCGFGERPFHVLWREIIKSQKSKFKFLEIGVYKGQVLSLVKYLSDLYEKQVDFYGVTPLKNLGDKYSTYEDTNYAQVIKKIFDDFNLNYDEYSNIINGSSIDENVKNIIIKNGKYDVIYIDGCHNYDCVVSDIKLMKDILEINGLVVLDDSSCYKDLMNSPTRFKGHLEVCNAIKDTLENDINYQEIICVGHNRVFLKKN